MFVSTRPSNWLWHEAFVRLFRLSVLLGPGTSRSDFTAAERMIQPTFATSVKRRSSIRSSSSPTRSVTPFTASNARGSQIWTWKAGSVWRSTISKKNFSQFTTASVSRRTTKLKISNVRRGMIEQVYVIYEWSSVTMSPFHSFYCPLSNDAIDVLLVKCVQFSSDDWSTKCVLRSLTHIPYSYLATSSATLDADNATFGPKDVSD